MWDVFNRLKVGSDHWRDVRRVAFSPDGRYLAAANGEWWSPREVKQWELSTGREILIEQALLWRNPVADMKVKGLAFNQKGGLLAWIADDGLGLRLQDLTRKQQVLYLKDFPCRYWTKGWPRLASYEHGLICSTDGRVLMGSRQRIVGIMPIGGKDFTPREEKVVEVWDVSNLPTPSVQQVEALPW